MKIRKVILENVKSYRYEEIEFHDGINVIAGRNGAGKSTLIEAIGLALFGYMNREYSYQDFVSYGAAGGCITVEFEVENCRYRIERSFNTRGTKGWVISDLETDEVIDTHTAEDVNYTLARILGMGEEISLAELFERIIGVSQGTFTEPFLRSANGRKEYFERIFLLDSYKAAYQKSNDPAGLFRSRADELEKELIRLRTRVEEYHLLKAQAKEEGVQLAERQRQFAEHGAALQTVRTEIQKVRAARELIQELESMRIQLAEQLKQLAERLSATEEAIRAGEEAKALVDAYRETHLTYLCRQEAIREMEGQLESQEQLIAEKQMWERDFAIAQENWTGRQSHLEAARSALMAESREKYEEFDEYNLPLEGIEKALRGIAEELEKTEKAAQDLLPVLKQYQDCEKLLQQLRERLAEGNTLRIELAELAERLCAIPDLSARVACLPQCEAEMEEVNCAISVLKAQIAVERENVERVGDGLCPLLKIECRTMEGRSLREHFQQNLALWEAALVLEDGKKAEIGTRLHMLREDARQLSALQILLAECNDRQIKLDAVYGRAAELVCLIDTALYELYTQLGALKKNGYLTLAGDLTYRAGLLLELDQEERRLATEMDIVLNNLSAAQSELKVREKRLLETKEEASRRRAEFNAKISQIQERRNAIAAKLNGMKSDEEKLAQDQLQLAAMEEKIKTLETAVQSFGDLRGGLKKGKDELARLEAGNQIYLKHEQKAAELPGLQELNNRLQRTLAETADRLEHTAVQLAAEAERMDPAAAEQLELRAEELNRLASQAETLVREGERRLQELTGRLNEMDRMKVQIRAKEGEESRLKKALDLMNFIRNVYNTSAEEIAQVFLQFISHEATQLYRQLSGENVQLIWEKDYQVKLKDKHRVRIFKQLSGGEQMSAAFAVRLALLRKFSTVRLGFFDEPTTHLDEYRRMNIAQAIAGIREKSDDYFEQIFVISHDDTFTTLTENLIRLEKNENGSYLAALD